VTVANRVGIEIGQLLALAHKRAARTFAQALEPLELDGRLFGVMSALARLGPVTQARLNLELDSDKSTMLRTVDELEQRGLAVRQPVPGDRRARTVVLTPTGRRQLTAATRTAERVAGELFSSMSTGEQTALRDLLARFVRDGSAG
jgi:DNA-binding MarR family transcriptional regulator